MATQLQIVNVQNLQMQAGRCPHWWYVCQDRPESQTLQCRRCGVVVEQVRQFEREAA